MYKITALAYALSLASIQAYPIADFEFAHVSADLPKCEVCGGLNCDNGVQFAASNIFPSSQFVGSGFRHTTVFPNLSFSTGGLANVLGMQASRPIAGQSCAIYPPASQGCEQTPPQQAPPAPPAPQGCDQSTDQTSNCAPEQTPPPQAPPAPQGCNQTTDQTSNCAPEQTPPPQAPPAPQGCNQTTDQTSNCTPEQTPPPQAPPAPQGCDQSTDQTSNCAPEQTPPQQAPRAVPCDQSNNINASSYKETTLYYNHKDVISVSISDDSSTQLKYSAN
ncbi:hypothetical protein FBU31_002501 [Coemansia sp. 'formosensis']|nr:hypothetical protein FBU31_002501 [Coemansia sp. 'formosensis']